MGGYFGITSRHECMADVFFGVDYHSHLGTRRAGLAAYDAEIGLQRKIHSIEHAPFRTKFETIFEEMTGTSAIGCISDSDPQPMLMRSHLGTYALCAVGAVNNAQELTEHYFANSHGHFDAMTGGRVNSVELLAAMIDQKDSFAEGIRYVMEKVEGSATLLLLKEDGALIAARDRLGRLPVQIARRDDGYAVSFESFAYEKMGYTKVRDLGPGEVVEITPDGITVLVEPGEEEHICAFLWSYYGYATSAYQGVGVEAMRCRNGQLLARQDMESGQTEGLDVISGVPDSGTPHAMGYAAESGVPYGRAFIKYTPTWSRSFMPRSQADRDQVARMKLIAVQDYIRGKNLLLVDDSLVRGTQLHQTVEFLRENGAKAVHMRSACPPIMYSCKYLNFSRTANEMELAARRAIMELEGEEGFEHIEEYADRRTERGQKLRRSIADKFGFASLDFQSLDNVVKAIGLEPCRLCTYCWNGKE